MEWLVPLCCVREAFGGALFLVVVEVFVHEVEVVALRSPLEECLACSIVQVEE